MQRFAKRLGRCLPLALLLGCAPEKAVDPTLANTGVGRQLAPGIFQLTGTHLRRGQTNHSALPELPDPAPPFTTLSGAVEIYGTAGYFIRYASWAEFGAGGSFEILPLDVRYPNGYAPPSLRDYPWDLRRYRIASPDGAASEILIGGSMTASGGRTLPQWPTDNANRRLYFFRPTELGSWVRDVAPIFGGGPAGWVGHSYGGNLFQPASDDPGVLQADAETYLFYEQVTENAEMPLKTEIFVRRMRSVDEASDDEALVIGVGQPPRRSTARSGATFLVEGPRPIRLEVEGQTFYVVAFSAGDYRTDGYTMSYAWARDVLGPYQVAMTEDGADYLDLGEGLKKRFGLSWAGRPAFYRAPNGSYEVIFHAVTKAIVPKADYTSPPGRTGAFFRSLFKATLRVDLAPDGSPRLAIPLQ